MKTATRWSYDHYTPLHERARATAPYICRLAPTETGFTFDFLDPDVQNASYVLRWHRRDSDETRSVALTGFSHTLEGLAPDTDYAFRVVRDDGVSSTERLVRTGAVPGIVVNYLHPDDPEYAFSGRYLCSPALLRLPNGDLLASMDLYAKGEPQNLTLIYVSHDDGATWAHRCELFPCFWGEMFLCGGALYMIGCSTEYGDLLIGRSDDNGVTWSAPTVLLRGACHCMQVGWHRAPMPVLIQGGRVMTDVQYGAWPEQVFCDTVISAPADCNLLDASNWVASDLWDARKEIDPLPKGIWGGIEGNVIVAPDGGIVDFLRFADRTALILRYDPDRPEAEMQLEKVIDFPATASKFDVVRDEKTGDYYTIASRALDEPLTKRNLLALFRSRDLRTWEHCRDLIDRRNDDPKQVGFQYVSFLIEGDDILYLCRTAVNGAHNFHDSNYTTFHKIKHFRTQNGGEK